MPELIPDGPTIPVHLLNELDSGKVVFFCGAGISVGPGSGLPIFADLVQHVYDANHIKPDAAEREALDLEESNSDRRRPNLDKALGLLERDERLGFRALRRTVIERLAVRPTGVLNVHKALIDLSRNKKGVRLITTNFDNRFVQAGLDEKLVDVAPRLPIPKPHSWSSLVHLHGRIAPNGDGSDLVLTAADFGRAYLTERWAARFVTELFREFTVVFVGYSVGDPVMSYMVDALAAERKRGARFATAYAFAVEDGTDAGRLKARDSWCAKNVEPILYDRRDDHCLLAETLTEWARIRRDPFHERSRIAINEIAKIPGGPDDPVVERVVWALQDPVAAKALADEPPLKDENEYAKLEQWLDMFTDKKMLCCAVGGIGPGASDQSSTVVQLVDNGFRSENPNNLDMTRRHLAVWLARSLHVPQLLAWVLRNGGHLNPTLRQDVQTRLAANDPTIPERLRLLWTVLLNNKTTYSRIGPWTSDRYAAATSEPERRQVEDEVIESIAPRLIVRPGPSSGRVFRQNSKNRPRPIAPVDDCGHLRLVSGEDRIRRWVREILQVPDVLSRHAETLTGHLEMALNLGKLDDRIYPHSSVYRPSISDHQQNRDHDAWTHLIDLARDSYFAVAAADRRRADNLLLRWVASRQPLFRRLALHALTDNPKSDIRLARNLLLAGRKPGLWELETQREVMRFFRLAGKRLPGNLRVEIVRAIHAGPKRSKGNSPYDDLERLRHEKALLLRKLSISGARLDKKSRALADAEAPQADAGGGERNEFLVWHGEVRMIRDEEFAPKDLIEGSVADVAAALKGKKVSNYQLRGLLVRKQVKVASALRWLAEQGEWPAFYWQGFLWHLAKPRERKEQPARLYFHVARILSGAPGELFNNVGTAAARFLSRLAAEYGTDQENEFGQLWTKAWAGKGEGEHQEVEFGQPLTAALNHPAGMLAEAALIRLQKCKPITGTGIPEVVRPYFEAIGEGPDGHLGRVMLATRLHYLFATDPDWVKKHMIERFSPGHSPETANLWSAYGWSPRLGPNLLRAFKGPFLEILQGKEQNVREPGNLRRLFMEVCLEMPGELTAQEIRSVVEQLPEKGLITLLRSLEPRLRGGTVEQGKIWRDKVHPWLRDYWPRESDRNTAGTSEAILEMLVMCGDAFPQAAEWSLEYLRRLNGRDFYPLCEHDHVKQHPDLILHVLDRVVDANDLPSHQRHLLREILDALLAAKAEMNGNLQFQGLYRLSTQ